MILLDDKGEEEAMSGAISAAVPSPKRKPPTVVASGLPLLFFQLSALWPSSLGEVVGRELPSAAPTTFSKLLIMELKQAERGFAAYVFRRVVLGHMSMFVGML
jgi:hypothetical protein